MDSFHLNVTHQARQPQADHRDIGNQQQDNEDRSEIDKQLFYNRLNLDTADLYADEQGCADRRGDGADAEVEDHHDAEVNRTHAERGANRQEDRGEDQAGRGHIHERTDNQQDHVNHQQDDILVVADRKQAGGYGGRNVGERHNPGHDAGYTDQEDDDTGHHTNSESSAYSRS